MTVIIGISHNTAADNVIDRRGRTIQVDGFLLEWKRADARAWDETGWEWDAAVTPTGIAGYFKPKSTPPCSAWAFNITPKPNAIATDQEYQTTEWLIADVNTNKITVTASNACGDTLPALVLTVAVPAASSSTPVFFYTVIIMASAAILTIVIVLKRRRGAPTRKA